MIFFDIVNIFFTGGNRPGGLSPLLESVARELFFFQAQAQGDTV